MRGLMDLAANGPSSRWDLIADGPSCQWTRTYGHDIIDN